MNKKGNIKFIDKLIRMFFNCILRKQYVNIYYFLKGETFLQRIMTV